MSFINFLPELKTQQHKTYKFWKDWRLVVGSFDAPILVVGYIMSFVYLTNTLIKYQEHDYIN